MSVFPENISGSTDIFFERKVMTNEIEQTEIPCYECICLSMCRQKSIGHLMKCEKAYDFMHPENTERRYPYTGARYTAFVKYMKLYGAK